MGVNITTIVYLRVLKIIQIGSTIILMVVEAQGTFKNNAIILGVFVYLQFKNANLP